MFRLCVQKTRNNYAREKHEYDDEDRDVEIMMVMTGIQTHTSQHLLIDHDKRRDEETAEEGEFLTDNVDRTRRFGVKKVSNKKEGDEDSVLAYFREVSMISAVDHVYIVRMFGGLIDSEERRKSEHYSKKRGDAEIASFSLSAETQPKKHEDKVEREKKSETIEVCVE